MLGEYSPDQEVTSNKGLIEELQQCAVWLGAETDREGGPRPESLRLLKCVMCETCAVLLGRMCQKRHWAYEQLFGQPVVLGGGYSVGQAEKEAVLLQDNQPVVSLRA